MPVLHVYPLVAGHFETDMVHIVTQVGHSASPRALISRDDLINALYVAEARTVYADVIFHSKPL